MFKINFTNTPPTPLKKIVDQKKKNPSLKCSTGGEKKNIINKNTVNKLTTIVCFK